MADVDLDTMVAALRARAHLDPEIAATTRRRILASVERRRPQHRRRVALLLAALTLGTGTLSWAATTGRLRPVLARLGLDAPTPSVAPARSPIERVLRPRGGAVALAPDPRSPVVVEVTPTPVVESAPAVAVAAEVAPAVTPPILPRRRLVRSAPPRSAVVAAATATTAAATAAFARADRLHRSGADVAALAAWDDYLTAHATGTLTIEARYNRALVLVRLRRWAQAKAALAPFAAGAVQPIGYRQADARALLEAIGVRESDPAGRTP